VKIVVIHTTIIGSVRIVIGITEGVEVEGVTLPRELVGGIHTATLTTEMLEVWQIQWGRVASLLVRVEECQI
tara:strand:+ start:86 stop:301 length:216 start_codon:yes stop_codon:yes gene_type:complete